MICGWAGTCCDWQFLQYSGALPNVKAGSFSPHWRHLGKFVSRLSNGSILRLFRYPDREPPIGVEVSGGIVAPSVRTSLTSVWEMLSSNVDVRLLSSHVRTNMAASRGTIQMTRA